MFSFPLLIYRVTTHIKRDILSNDTNISSAARGTMRGVG
jgi:hypothetical protein